MSKLNKKDDILLKEEDLARLKKRTSYFYFRIHDRKYSAITFVMGIFFWRLVINIDPPNQISDRQVDPPPPCKKTQRGKCSMVIFEMLKLYNLSKTPSRSLTRQQ